MRLIDADALNDYVMDTWGGGNIDNTVIWYGDVLEAIHNAPTIDAVPVVHGRWEIKLLNDYQKYRVTCSICGWVGIENYDSYDVPSDFNYCPNCGAKMDLIWEKDNND